LGEGVYDMKMGKSKCIEPSTEGKNETQQSILPCGEAGEGVESKTKRGLGAGFSGRRKRGGPLSEWQIERRL